MSAVKMGSVTVIYICEVAGHHVIELRTARGNLRVTATQKGTMRVHNIESGQELKSVGRKGK